MELPTSNRKKLLTFDRLVLSQKSTHFPFSFMGSTIQKTGKFGQTAGPIGNQFCTYNADESGNGHRLNELAP